MMNQRICTYLTKLFLLQACNCRTESNSFICRQLCATLSLHIHCRPLSRAWATISCPFSISSHNGAEGNLSLRKQLFTTWGPYSRWPQSKYGQSPRREVRGGQYRDVHDLGAFPYERTGMATASESSKSEMPQKIHVLGAGCLGMFVAHQVSGIPDRPRITLLIRSPAMLNHWIKSNKSLEVVTRGVEDQRYGFDVELLPLSSTEQPAVASKKLGEDPLSPEDLLGKEDSTDQASDSNIIHHLILSVKAPHTMLALTMIAHRLTQDSTIVFLQNGLGMVDEVNEQLFPDESTRPNYIVGVISHGVYRTPSKYFSVVHAGFGTLALGVIPRRSMLEPPRATDGISQLAPSARYLMRILTQTPQLVATGFTPTDMLQLQLEKLAMNCIINPLTVMYDCRNRELLDNDNFRRVVRLLLAEISLVIRSLPELQGIPNVVMRFSPDRLEHMVFNLSRKTGENLSSMLQDVRAGKKTEIDYLNGYIIRRGEKLGITCVLNYMVLQMVKGKGYLQRTRDEAELPLQTTAGSNIGPEWQGGPDGV